MKILVTGCFGFIGSNLVSYLLNNGCEVIGIDNLLNPSINPTDRIKASTKNWDKFTFWNADIRDLQNMHSIMINHKPSIVVHLAALGSVPRSWDQPGLVTDINERGFINILQSATAIKVKRLVFASSSSVYGPTDKNVRWEGQPLFPASPYALTKVQNERFANLWCGNMGVEWMALRFFNVYGPGQRHDSDYSAVIPRFLTGDKIKIYGDGLTIRDFTYVEDVCRSIFKAIVCEKSNEVFNVGTGYGTNLNRLAELCNDDASKREVVHLDARHGDSRCSIADVSKLYDILGVKNMTPIERGIKLTKEFFESIKGQI
jgi:nucleoside-diphosphate-sugar epimerase